MSLLLGTCKYLFKSATPATNQLRYVMPKTLPAIKSAEQGLSKTFTAVKAGTKEAAPKGLEEALNVYNEVKLLRSEKFKTGTRIIENWNPAFGVKSPTGEYKFAIEHLNQTGAIDRYIQQRFPSITSKDDIQRIKNILNNYLEKNLDIYTYERITNILSKYNSEISEKLAQGGILYIPDKSKSYNIIAELYKQINPNAKTITGYNNLKTYLKDKKGVNIIVLDDCLVSGESATKLHKNIFKDIENANEKVKNLDLYLLTAYSDGLKKVPKDIKVHYDGTAKRSLNQSDYFKKEVAQEDKGLLLGALGLSDTKYNAYGSIMFPYMSPNNNSIFSAQMIKSLFSGPECAIKGVFAPVEAQEKILEGVKRMLEKTKTDAA